MNDDPVRLLRRVRIVLAAFILGLVVSGLTAFPLSWEMGLAIRWLGLEGVTAANARDGLSRWLITVHEGLRDTYGRYPWNAYGTDWLAFAHLVIAVFFLGPLKDPVRNVWVLRAGLIACAGVIPLAMLCGAVRGIPFGWRLMDSSFGVLGAVPLYYCLHLVRKLERCGVGEKALPAGEASRRTRPPNSAPAG